MVYVFLADGFEIIEALSPVDMLRRAGIEVKTVGVTGQVVQASCGVKVTADVMPEEVSIESAQAVVIPGGLPGVTNLEESEFVKDCVLKAADSGKFVCAICAGPSLIGKLGLLKGKNAISYPGFEQYLEGAEYTAAVVEKDGNFITGKGPGAAFDFALAIVETLKGKEKVEELKSAMCMAQ